MFLSLRLIVLLISLSFLFACGSTKDINTGDVETVFKEAVRLFNEEDYLDSKKYFDVIKLQYPSSQYADDAQYYVAEIDYNKGDYVLAAYNYNRLRTSYPSSEYVIESLFKAALSYYQLSPPYDRDQEYTHKAIEAFNLFQRLYPNDNKYADAGDYIKELREKLAFREFFTAELYRKMREPYSSLVYYQEVIDDYPDSQYYEQAYVGKIEVLTLLRRYDEARGLIDLYRRIFSSGKLSNNISAIESTIPNK